MREDAFFHGSDHLEVFLSLPETEVVVRTAQNAFGVRLILPIVLPKANWADVVAAAFMERLKFAARTAIGFCALSRLKNPLHLVVHFGARCSAAIAALTASTGDLIAPMCSTAKNRRLSLPSTGEDQA